MRVVFSARDEVENLNKTVEDVCSAIARLAQAAHDLDDPEPVARLWDALGRIRNETRVTDDVAEHLAKVMRGHELRTLLVEGLPPIVTRQPKARTSWRRDELVPAILTRLDEVPRLLSSTGEVESEAEHAVRVLGECVSLGAGKVTGLRKLGLDPDEYCETTEKPERAEVQR